MKATDENNYRMPGYEPEHKEKYRMDADDPEDDDLEEESTEWGDVDPQHDPNAPRGPMDPTAPGSAV